jgi:hypothetical protein
LAKGEKISPEGTISLVGDPRRWGGMSGKGSGETYKKLIERQEKALEDLYAKQKKERENIMKKIEKDPHNLELVKELDTKRYEHQQAEIKMIDHQGEETDRFKSNHEQ